MGQPLPDHLGPGLRIVFVGFNPGLHSARVGHHYAGPSNRFWSILHRAGLTPRRFEPREDALLPGLGYGLTNIVDRPTRSAAEITPGEYAEGRVRLRRKIERCRPRVVCFVGKGVYLAWSGRREAAWGFQETRQVEGVAEFVAPSSSGLVSLPPAEVVAIYARLAGATGSRQPASGP